MSDEISGLYKNIKELLSNIDTDDIIDDNSGPSSKVIEEQKVYIWIRLYLKEEDSKLLPNDNITLSYKDEVLVTKFICYGKAQVHDDIDDFMIKYDSEDNKKILCLMIDINSINYNDNIPFLRTLFKIGIHYEYQLVKRDDLKFIIDRTGEVIDYYDSDF